MVLHREERSGSGFTVAEAEEFRSVLDRLGVVDLPLTGEQWTWSNQRSRSRIDRFFLLANLLLNLDGVVQRTLPRPTSDHYPICLEVERIKWGPIPFRLENRWLEEERFCAMVEEEWNGCRVQSCASYMFAYKLKELKRCIKQWTKEELVKEKSNVENILNEIDALDKKEVMVDLSEEERDKMGSLLKLAAHLKAEELSWRQKYQIFSYFSKS